LGSKFEVRNRFETAQKDDLESAAQMPSLLAVLGVAKLIDEDFAPHEDYEPRYVDFDS
jgi:hypothetical protein